MRCIAGFATRVRPDRRAPAHGRGPSDQGHHAIRRPAGRAGRGRRQRGQPGRESAVDRAVLRRGRRPSKGSDASSWKLKLTVDPAVAVGVYPIRVQTDDGISNPFLLAVGQLPQVVEKEENSTFELAQPIPEPPLVVEGKVAGNDVDYFRFRGRKGQRIVVDAQCARIGSGIDPTIRLTTGTARRTYVASADDTPGLLTDARLTAVLPEDSDYVVEISDTRYQGAGRPVYRLVIGAVPMAEEVYPLGGRAGETVGLELRGGTLSGVQVAAATVQAPFGIDTFQPRITGCMVGSTAPARAGPRLRVDAAAGRLALSRAARAGRPVGRAGAGRRAGRLQRPDRPARRRGPLRARGDAGLARADQGPGVRAGLGARCGAPGRGEQGGASIANADDTTIPLPPKNGDAPVAHPPRPDHRDHRAQRDDRDRPS